MSRAQDDAHVFFDGEINASWSASCKSPFPVFSEMPFFYQIKKNVELSRATGHGTLEQKTALEMTGRSVKFLNNDLIVMAENIAKIAVSSQSVCENTKNLTEQTEQNIDDDEGFEF